MLTKPLNAFPLEGHELIALLVVKDYSVNTLPVATATLFEFSGNHWLTHSN
jgi:hypothetical protein